MLFPGLWSCCFKENARLILGKLAVALPSPASAKQGIIFPTAFPVPLLFFRWMNFSFLLNTQMLLPFGAAFPTRSFNTPLFLSTCKAALAHTCCVIGSFSLRRGQYLFCFLNRERHSQEILLSCLLTTEEILKHLVFLERVKKQRSPGQKKDSRGKINLT